MPSKRNLNRVERYLILSDIHSVYFDERNLGAALAVLSENEFDRVYLNGDVLDCQSLSKFPKEVHEDFGQKFSTWESFLYEIMDTRKNILRPLRKAARDTDIVYRTFANHEARYLNPKSDSTALAEIRKVEEKLGARARNLHDLLDLGRYEITIDKKQDSILFGEVLIIHGERATVTAPRANMYDAFQSVISSHTHRLGIYRHTTRGGKRLFAGETGHLRSEGDKVEYAKKPPDWQAGYATLERNGYGDIDFNQYPIINGRTEYNGTWYSW